MNKIILLLALSSCGIHQQAVQKENNFGDLILGWWERIYPHNVEPNKPWNLTHIEFMDDGECRYNIGYNEGEKYKTHTINNNKWIVDSNNSHAVFVKAPYKLGPSFSASVIRLNKSELVFELISDQFTDTIYMKKLKKLH